MKECNIIDNTMQLHFIGMIIVTFGLGEVMCRTFTTEEGPFNLIMYNTSNCVKEQPWFQTNVTVFKDKNVLHGTIVNKKEIKNVKFRIQAYYLDQGKIKVFEIKNQNCQNTIIQMVLKTLGIPYNGQKCTMKPINAEFNNLNLDAVFHMVVQKIWYGSMVIRWEIAEPAATIMCLDIHAQIVKAKTVDNKENS
ncbi:uncharacterized protein LOC133528923 [Cydia pomonella]|uniref:uncharacterized protein LOC133528923 n=1 Tax=Cydia pomonella TaxID=82600 RepID=UPI002ADD37CE|nr:uncharacterized protein LOC133528923 [Cydia pomonella]